MADSTGMGCETKDTDGVKSNVKEDLKSIKLYGRGGQGIVTAGELIALAAFEEERYAQAIPNFGAERRGGPAFCSLRISNKPILLVCDVNDTEVICMFDPTIWHHRNMFTGLQPGGILIFNTQKSGEVLRAEMDNKKYGFSPPVDDYEIYTIDATSLALEILKKPIANTAMIGAFSKATGFVSTGSIIDVIKKRMKRNIDENCELVKKAYETVERNEG